MDSDNIDKVAGVVNHSNLTIFAGWVVLYEDLSIYESLLDAVVQNHLRGPHLSSRVTILTLSKPSFIVLIDIF